MKVSYSLTATLTLALTITSLTMSHAQLSTPVLMHYMPWFTLERENTHWSMQLREKDDLYLMERYQQTGRVAAHYTPLIGPYSSKDEDTIRLHLELLRQAGVGGVIINWYGISSRYDYPVLKEASDTIIRLANTTGMLWTLCYEDRTIDVTLSEEDKVAQLQADWEYIRDVYIEQYSGTMLRATATKRPVFLQFGPVTLYQPSTWTNMLHTVFSNISERPHLLGVDKGNPQNILPDGGFNWIGWDLFRNPTADNIKTFHTSFYQRAQDVSWYPIVGSTFPRFRDYYVQGNSPSASPQPWWNVTVPSFNGDTIDISIVAAREGGADVIQAVSWNDWQEGTSFEPSAEEGYTQLLRLQEHVLGREDEESMRNAVLAYNDVKASVWQQCDRVTPESKVDCGTKDTTEISCEASGCCWRPSSQPGPWCFHKVSSPGVCKQPAPGIRNCTRTPEDRLCYCSTLMSSVVPSSKPSDDPSSSPSSEPLSVPSCRPSSMPSSDPSVLPSLMPVVVPSSEPSNEPSSSPSSEPSSVPSRRLDHEPSETPSSMPSGSPSCNPSTEFLTSVQFVSRKNSEMCLGGIDKTVKVLKCDESQNNQIWMIYQSGHLRNTNTSTCLEAKKRLQLSFCPCDIEQNYIFVYNKFHETIIAAGLKKFKAITYDGSFENYLTNGTINPRYQWTLKQV